MNDSPIDKIVVLMLENQSFDNLLGFVPGIGKLDGTQFAVNYKGEKIYVTPEADPIKNNIFDPPHSHESTLKQLYGQKKYVGQQPSGKGMLTSIFPKGNKKKEIEFMKCYDSSKYLPAISTLAKNFICCDRWFSSVPGPTGPNRLFLHAATCGGYTGDGYLAYKLNTPPKIKTIFETMDMHDLDWRIYLCKNLNVVESFSYIKKNKNRIFPLNQFFSDIAESKLANYTFLSPDLKENSQHPGYNPKNLINGDNLIADIYEAIRNNQKIWESALFIVTYDEGGGYYDSIVCKEEMEKIEQNWNKDDKGIEYDFKYLGIRVPAIFISAYFEHKLDHTLYEHSSIPSSLKKLFNLKSNGPDGFLTLRDKNANDIFLNNKFNNKPRKDLMKLPRNLS